jgi:hypothetical protein
MANLAVIFKAVSKVSNYVQDTQFHKGIIIFLSKNAAEVYLNNFF